MAMMIGAIGGLCMQWHRSRCSALSHLGRRAGRLRYARQMAADTPCPAPGVALPSLPRAWQRRLREVWRSAGWPWQDVLEAELLAAGLLERRTDAAGCETLRLSDAGVRALAASAKTNRRALDAHEALVARVALEMQRAGRIVWRGLSLRASLAQADPAGASDAAPAQRSPDAACLPGFDPESLAFGGAPAARWVLARPDVYSIRPSTREDAVEPVVHEIKVTRADLMADLRLPDKRAAYLALSSQCWYVLRAGIGAPEESPPEFGVLEAVGLAGGAACAAERSGMAGPLRLVRAASRRAHRLGLATWIALARAAPQAGDEIDPAGLDGLLRSP
jgi:hypothetical protein